MASFLSQASTAPHLGKYPNQYAIFYLHHHHHHQYSPRIYRLKCSAQKQDNLASPRTSSSSSSSSSTQTQKKNEPENVVLKIAWYASELLGIAASLFRSSPSGSIEEGSDLSGDGSGPLDRALVVETIKQDFQRSYFVTGNLTVGAYEENCEFADPAGSFRGLGRFKRNCTNFGSLIERCNMKLIKWEDFEDKGIGHWRFSCVLSFPWKPILSATGYTEYYFDPKSGKLCRHVEHWNVPKMVLLKQIFKPSRQITRKEN